MINRIFSSTNLFFIILYLIALVQWTFGQSTPCAVLKTSVMCENVEGNFLANVRRENITVINIVRSTLMYLSEKDFSKFTNVREIIIDKSEVPHSILNYTLSLKELKILKIINSNVTENCLTALRNSSTLVTLSLKGNNLIEINTDIFCSLSSLEEIDLSHNELVSFRADAFPDVSALRKLDMSFNRFISLSRLNEDFDMSRLEEYDLSHNEISTITAGAFLGCYSLRKLDLSYNMLSILFDFSLWKGVFYNLSLLEEIDLSHNMIFTLGGALLGLASLRKLDISNNRLVRMFDYSIKMAFFDSSPRLEEIDLSHNEIPTIEADAFESLSALRRLDLSFNLLDDFDPASLSLPAGCVFQLLLVTCPEPSVKDFPSVELQRPAHDAATADLKPQEPTGQQDLGQGQEQHQDQRELEELHHMVKELLQNQQRQERQIEQLMEEQKRQKQKFQQQQQEKDKEEEKNELELESSSMATPASDNTHTVGRNIELVVALVGCVCLLLLLATLLLLLKQSLRRRMFPRSRGILRR